MLCPTPNAQRCNREKKKQGIKKPTQLTIRLFFFFPLSPVELGGELFSEALPGVSTRTCGVDALTGRAEGVLVGAALAAIFGAPLTAELVVSPPVRDRMNEPGSPTRGLSSMNSSP